MKNKICKKCGKEYWGSPHSRYCDNCRETALREQREKDLKRIKNRKLERTCIICGKKFISYNKKATCSIACEIKLKSNIKQGHVVEEVSKEKIAKENSHMWHLVSPEGKHYKFKNLAQWARENTELFGFEKSEKNAKRVSAGVIQAKRGKIVCTYKDWRVIDDPSEYGAREIIKLYKMGLSINKIHEMTGKSSSKIRKLLITKGLWKDELSQKVAALLREGKTEEEIAEILGKSKKLINSRCPYTKGMYGWDLSPNALRIRKCRENKKRE